MGLWMIAHSSHRVGRALADRHYSRQSPGSARFVPPGRSMTLILPGGDAVWATSWQYPEFTKHAWPGAWVCSLFRNESSHLSSDLIREAVSITRWFWGSIPDLGMVTFVNGAAVRSTNPGYCFMRAGFLKVGMTTSGLHVLQLLPADMPGASMPIGAQLPLEAA